MNILQVFHSGWHLGIQGFSVNSRLLQSPKIQCKWLLFPLLILCTCVSGVSRATCPISKNKIQLPWRFMYLATPVLTMLSSKLQLEEKLEPSNWWLDSAKQNRQSWESLFIYWTKQQHFTRVRTETTLIQATLYRLARWAKTTVSFVFLRIKQKALQLLILFLTSQQLPSMQMRLMLLETTKTCVTICRVLATLPTLLVHFIHYIMQTKIHFEFQKIYTKRNAYVCL